MEIVRVSHKYQVVIPLEIRRAMGITPGQQVQLRQCETHIELVPLQPVRYYRGFLRGIETDIPNDDE